MSTWRVAAIVVGCGLVAAWAAACAGACVYARGPVAAWVPAAPVMPVASEGDHPYGIGLAAMESRPPPSLSPQPRNVFRLRDQPLVPAPSPAWVGVKAAPDEPVAPAAAPAPLPLTLAGIAESRQGGHAVRTAVISGAGELWLVTEGMVVAGRYRVDRVDIEVVVLVDTAGGQPWTLRLR